MKQLALFLIMVNCMGLALTAKAQVQKSTVKFVEIKKEKKKKEVSLKLDTYLRLRESQDEYMSSSYGGGIFELSSELKFHKKLTADIIGGAFMMSGNHTNYYNGEGKAPNKMYIDVVSVNFKPSPSITLSAGLVNTSLASFNSAFYPGGMPGISEQLKFNVLGADVTLSANQVAPSVDAQKVRTEVAKGASMNVETASLKAGNIKKDSAAELLLEGTHFNIRGMNVASAKDSVFYGNTVVGSGDAARYAYEFEGFEYGAKSQVRIFKGLDFGVSGSRIVNIKAPAGSNSGYSASAGPTITLGNVEIKPQYTRFYLESDVMPGGMTNPGNAMANRQGHGAVLRMKLIEEDVALSATWNHAREIKDTPYQSDRTTYFMTVETSYEIL